MVGHFPPRVNTPLPPDATPIILAGIKISSWFTVKGDVSWTL